MEIFVREKEKIKSVAVETENDILIGNSAIEVKSLEQHDRELLEGFVNELKKRVGKNKFKVFSVSPYCLCYKSFIKELAELLKERGV